MIDKNMFASGICSSAWQTREADVHQFATEVKKLDSLQKI